ncbi:MAG: creatininase family protein [Longimicrobiales bacterium]
MTGRPYVLRETPWSVIRGTDYQVAMLPWGATEAHNYHLPYGTDVYQAESVAVEAARLAWEQGARVTVLPAIPFGVNTGQLDIPLTINLNPSTQSLMLRDIADSLVGQGLRKLVLLNGHGGNDFRPPVRELQRTHELLIVVVNCWQIEPADRYLPEPGDHAGALETAMMQHLHPSLVLPLSEAGNGATLVPMIQGLREGWAWTPRRWTQVSRDTGVGDPAGATANAGQQFFQAITKRLSQLLTELAACPHDRFYTDSHSAGES